MTMETISFSFLSAADIVGVAAGQTLAYFLGKKEKDGDVDVRGAEKLSKAERERLNWDLGYDEVERQGEVTQVAAVVSK